MSVALPRARVFLFFIILLWIPFLNQPMISAILVNLSRFIGSAAAEQAWDVVCFLMTIVAIGLGLLSGECGCSSSSGDDDHLPASRWIFFEFLNASQPHTSVEHFMELVELEGAPRVVGESSDEVHQLVEISDQSVARENLILVKRHTTTGRYSDELQFDVQQAQADDMSDIDDDPDPVQLRRHIESEEVGGQDQQELSQADDPDDDPLSAYNCSDAEINSKAAAFIASFREQMRRECYQEMLLYASTVPVY